MTFEEFFIKKKIDLDQLKNAEAALYEEFRYDFSQMGEKSFDHTKKFWFNKLRKLYHLKPAGKPEIHKPERNSLARQAEPLASLTIEEKPRYAPKFKPAAAVRSVSEVNSDKKDREEFSGTEQPAGSQPPLAQTESINDSAAPRPEDNAERPKPAYKPRFKAPAIKKEPEQPAQASAEGEEKNIDKSISDAPQAKPAYKPRFKPGMASSKPKKDDSAESNN